MHSNVRVRFAPSPTGNPHIGNVRTAIFAWLFAGRHDGAFMIRVEDTDQSRRTEGAVEAMLESPALGWLGLGRGPRRRRRRGTLHAVRAGCCCTAPKPSG